MLTAKYGVFKTTTRLEEAVRKRESNVYSMAACERSDVSPLQGHSKRVGRKVAEVGSGWKKLISVEKIEGTQEKRENK